MDIRYEINSENAALIYFGGSEVPGVYQDGDYDAGEVPFKSAKNAKAWAEKLIADIAALQQPSE